MREGELNKILPFIDENDLKNLEKKLKLVPGELTNRRKVLI